MFVVPKWVVFFFKHIMRAKRALLITSMLTVIASFCSAVTPVYIGRIIDLVTKKDQGSLLALSSVILGSLLLTELINVLRKLVSTRAMLHLTYDLMHDIVTSVLNTSSDFFIRTQRGELLQRCIQDVRTIQQFGLLTIPGLAQEIMLACIAVTVVSTIYWPIIPMILACYFVLFIPVHIFGKKRGIARKHLVQHSSLLRHSLLEKLETAEQIKIFGTEQYEYEKVKREQAIWANLTYQEDLLNSAYKGFPRIPDALAPALVFLFCGWQIMQGNITLGQLTTVIAFIPALNAPVRSIFNMYTVLADIRVRIDGILEYLELQPEPGKGEGLQQLSSYRSLPITFDSVSVQGDRGPILKDISFIVHPGEQISIVGPSGAGKSTLLKLLARLVEPTEGEIIIGAIPLKQLDATHLRQRVGYVTQEAVLLRDSLLNNLTLLQKAEIATIERWIKAFQAEDIIAIKPEGFQMVIEEKGVQLSGGQRQVICLIRTLIKHPDILLLDEATASLDQASEAIVLNALDKLTEPVTRISITHRLHNVQQADRILVLEHGRLIQQGTHDELLKQSDGLYSRLWFSQQKVSEEGDYDFGLDTIA